MKTMFLLLFHIGFVTGLLTCSITLGSSLPRYAIIITEIMADPDPPVMLPNYEFIELYNKSYLPVWITGFTLSDKTTTGRIEAPTLMQPGSYLIVCAAAHKDIFAIYGTVATLTRFPSLDNSGDLLVLADDQNNTIHAISYHISWYKHPVKQTGGWSLEMIDLNMACYDTDAGNKGSNNWKASTHAAGGTPGMPNSNAHSLTQVPELLKVHSFIMAPDHIHIQFDQALADGAALAHNGILIQESGANTWQPIKVLQSHLTAPHFKELIIQTDYPIQSDKLYQLELRNIATCMYATEPIISIKVPCAVGAMPTPNAVSISELLFDPVPPVEDYLEIYNKGHTAIDLTQLHLAHINTQGALVLASKVAASTQLLFPNEYLAISTNTQAIWENYPGTDFQQLQLVTSMPSMPNAGGTVVLVGADGVIIDQVAYSPKWHHPLIRFSKGVSLEKIHVAGNGTDPNNWHSAAIILPEINFNNSSITNTYNYGSPGKANSQSKSNINSANAYFSMTDKLFSPNNDGHQDFLLIQYQLPEPGWIVNCSIFHKDGSLARTLAQQTMLGTKGTFMWDGTNNARQVLGTGHYICKIEAFHNTGKKINWKRVISLFNPL